MTSDESTPGFGFEYDITNEDVYEAAKAHVLSVATRLLGADADKLALSMTEEGNLSIQGPDDLVDRLEAEIARMQAAGEWGST